MPLVIISVAMSEAESLTCLSLGLPLKKKHAGQLVFLICFYNQIKLVMKVHVFPMRSQALSLSMLMITVLVYSTEYSGTLLADTAASEVV